MLALHYTHRPLSLVLVCALCGACSKKSSERPGAARAAPSSSGIDAPRPPILSDADITAPVETSLRRDPGVASADIHVRTTDGIVELTGSAPDLLTKRRAVRVAEAVKGVRAVSERLELKLAERPDSQLKEHVENTLRLDTAAQASAVRVSVNRGIVTLMGSVRSYQQRDLCRWLAESVAGVRDVDDQLRVEPEVTRNDGEIAADVESRLRWDALVNDGLIQVTVRDAVVTLNGQVASAAERRRAAADAWVRGTKRVNDSDLKVRWWAAQHDLTKDKLLGKSDESIAKAIRDAAAYDPRVAAANLQIGVKGGAVTLSGSVPTMNARFAAEDLAYNTVGVTTVHNDLAVRPTHIEPDGAIKRAVRGALLWNPYTNTLGIDVAVKGGSVTLSGVVNNAFQRATATEVASNVLGVIDIDSKLHMKQGDVPYVYTPYHYPYGPYWGRSYSPPTTTRADAEIARDIRSELEWSPFVDGARVHVKVQGGKAVLTGEVATPRQRTDATWNAYEGGALQVDNRLRLDASG